MMADVLVINKVNMMEREETVAEAMLPRTL